MALKSLFSSAVIFCFRTDVKEALRNELKRSGVQKIEIAANVDEARQKLGEDEDALLVLEWDQDPGEAVKVLEATKKENTIEVRPILLIAKAMSQQLVATAYEYHVSQAFAGEVSQKILAERLREISRQEENNEPLKKVFGKVISAKTQGQYGVAEGILEEIMNRIPNNDRIAAELAEVYIAQDKWDQARDLVSIYADKTPANMRILHIYGRCLMRKGDFESASEVLEKAKAFNPYNSERLIDLGYSLLNQNRIDEARNNFKEARSIDPSSKKARSGMGQVMLLEGDVNQALSLMKNVADNKELASLFNMSAVLSMRQGRFQAGMSLYDAALQSLDQADKNTLAMLHFNRGVGFKRWKKPEEAITWFAKAVDLKPDYEKAKRNFAEVADKLGRAVPEKYRPAGAEEEIKEEMLSADNAFDATGSGFSHDFSSDSLTISDDEFGDDDFDGDGTEFL